MPSLVSYSEAVANAVFLPLTTLLSVVTYFGVHAYRVSSFIVKAGRGGEAQRFRVDTYCCLGDENTDFDRTVVSFCLPDSETLPSDISISVDSEVPVLFSGKFSSVKTNNPADEQRFFVYAQCFSVPFLFSYSLEEDKKAIGAK